MIRYDVTAISIYFRIIVFFNPRTDGSLGHLSTDGEGRITANETS